MPLVFLLVTAENQIIDGFSRIEARRQFVRIESLANWVRGKRGTAHERISSVRIHQIDLKLHHVLVWILVVHRERQSVANWPHRHDAERLETFVGRNQLIEILPGVSDMMNAGVVLAPGPFLGGGTKICVL